MEDFRQCGLVGERATVLTAYLAAISRKLSDRHRLSYQMIADRIRDYALQVDLKANVHMFRYAST